MSKFVYGVLVIGLCVLAASHNTSNVYADGIISSADNGAADVADAQGGVGNVLADSDDDGAEGDADEIEKKTQELIKKEKDEFDAKIDDANKAIETADKRKEELRKEIAELEKKETPEKLIKELGGPDPENYEPDDDHHDDWETAADYWIEKNGSKADQARYQLALEYAAELKAKKTVLKAWENRGFGYFMDRWGVSIEKGLHCSKWPLEDEADGDGDDKDGEESDSE